MTKRDYSNPDHGREEEILEAADLLDNIEQEFKEALKHATAGIADQTKYRRSENKKGNERDSLIFRRAHEYELLDEAQADIENALEHVAAARMCLERAAAKVFFASCGPKNAA